MDMILHMPQLNLSGSFINKTIIQNASINETLTSSSLGDKEYHSLLACREDGFFRFI